MTETKPKSHSPAPPPSSSSSSSSRVPTEFSNGPSNNHCANKFSGHNIHYPNPPNAVNPNTATLRYQWRYAIKQYSRWYSLVWGTAIFAGTAFFALGWVIKGGNPLPSFGSKESSSPASSESEKARR